MKILDLLVFCIRFSIYSTLLNESEVVGVEKSGNNQTIEKLQNLKRELQTWLIDSVKLRKKIEEESAEWRKELLNELKNEESNQSESQWAMHIETIKSTIIQVQQDNGESIDASILEKSEWTFKRFFRKIFGGLWFSKFWLGEVWDWLADSTSSTIWWWITWLLWSIPFIWKYFKKKNLESVDWLSDYIKKSINNLSNFPEDKLETLPFMYNKDFLNDENCVWYLKSFLDKIKIQENVLNNNTVKNPSLIESDNFWRDIFSSKEVSEPYVEQIRQKIISISNLNTWKISQEEFFKKMSELNFQDIKKQDTVKQEASKNETNLTEVQKIENKVVSTPVVTNIPVKDTASNSEQVSLNTKIEVPHKTLQQQVTEWIVDRFFLSDVEHSINFDCSKKNVIFDWKVLPIKMYYKVFWSYDDYTDNVLLTDLSLNWVSWSYDITIDKWPINVIFDNDIKENVLTQLSNNWYAELMDIWKNKDIWIKIW